MGSNKYVVIHGASGNGKTWLYKKVFQEAGIHFDVINLGAVLTAGSLEAAFSQKLGEWGYLSDDRSRDKLVCRLQARRHGRGSCDEEY